jgi:hypothetical protein
MTGQQIYGTSLPLANFQVTKSVATLAANALTYPLPILACDDLFTASEYGVYTGTVYISIADVGSDLCSMVAYPCAILSGNAGVSIKKGGIAGDVTVLYNDFVTSPSTTANMVIARSTNTGADAGVPVGTPIIRIPRAGIPARRVIASFVGNKVAMD